MPNPLYLEIEREGERISIGSCKLGHDFEMLSVTGLDAPDYAVTMQSSGSEDGGYINKARLDSRTIKVVFDVKEDTENELERIRSLCPPHFDVTITAHRGNVQRTAIGRVTGLSSKQETIFHDPSITITFLCPFPYLMGPVIGKDSAATIPAVVFPLAIPPSGLISGYMSMDSQPHLENDGDVPAGMVVRFIAAGPVINPQIKNLSTGEYVRLIDTLSAGDELIISTTPKNKYVQLNGKNHIHKIDRSSTFFSLLCGDNALSYSSDEGWQNLDVYLSYTPLYLGV